MKKTYEKIYAVVRQIPAGRVATYGQIAELAGLFGKPRVVGYALFRIAQPPEDIPWHRVVNAKGEVSYSQVRNGSDYLQRSLLEDEGIEFQPSGKLDLLRYRWQPDIGLSMALFQDSDAVDAVDECGELIGR